MANIVIYTNDTNYSTVNEIISVIDTQHNVDTLAASADSANQLMEYDLIISFGLPDTATIITPLVSAFYNGTPVLAGGSSASGVRDNTFAQSSGLVTAERGDSRRDSIRILSAFAGIYDASILNQIVEFAASTDYAEYYLRPYAIGNEPLTSTVGYNEGDSTIAFPIGTVSLNGQETSAKALLNGTMYAANSYTSTQVAAFNAMIKWLCASEAKYSINGTVTLDGQPYSSRLVVTSVGDEPAVVGTGVSDESGDYTIDTGSYNGAVLVHSVQDYGNNWQPSTTLEFDQVIHPTVPNGYVFRVTSVGTTGTQEPTWPALPATQVTDGGVTYTSETLLEPVIQGYVTPTLV